MVIEDDCINFLIQSRIISFKNENKTNQIRKVSNKESKEMQI